MNKPILFSGPMVQAILREIRDPGTGKTQTRRVVQLADDLTNKTFTGKLVNYYGDRRLGMEFEGTTRVQPIRFSPGDRLWVRETWQAHSWASDCVTIRYRAEAGTKGFTDQIEQIPYPEGKKDAFKFVACKGPDFWRPSLHMPRWASRITLEVTDVRVQRLQEITLGDICAEGLASSVYDFKPVQRGFDAWINLWDSLNADRAPWASNPWVCAVTFRPHLCNIDQMRAVA